MAVNETLADIALDLIAWFELVDDDTLHPDVAVKAMEQIAYKLHQLGPEDRQWFAAHARRRAATERDPRFGNTFLAVADDLLTG